MAKKKAKKKEPEFDDYEYGYGYDYLLDDEQQKKPTDTADDADGRKMMKAPGGRMSRKRRYWPASAAPISKTTGRITARASRMMRL